MAEKYLLDLQVTGDLDPFPGTPQHPSSDSWLDLSAEWLYMLKIWIGLLDC